MALLLGITTGLSLLAIAGARRTQSSYDQFLRATNASTISVDLPFGFSWDMNQQIAALDGVKSSRTYVSLSYAILTDGRIDFPRSLAEPMASIDGAYFDQDRFVAREGRVPDPDRVDEVAVNEFAAARSGFRVGERLEVATFGPLQPLDPNSATQPVPLRTIEVEVVGIGSFPEEILQDEADRSARLLLTPAFTAANMDSVTYGLQYLQLDHASADAESVQARLREVDTRGSLDVRLTSVDQARGRRALRPLSISLAVLGVIAGVIGLVLGGQALVRLQRREGEEAAMLVAFGAPPRAVVASSLIAPLVTIIAATGIAVAVAIAASPLMPLGPVRGLGVADGVDIDRTVIGLGVVAVIALATLIVLRTALIERAGSARPKRRARTSRAVATAASLAAPPTLTTGVGMAMESGTGARTVPMRSVMAGTALAVATLIIAVTFVANLHTLTHTARLYGWDWDATIVAGSGYGNLEPAPTDAVLKADPNVVAWSGAYLGAGVLDDESVPLLGMAIGSEVRPPIISGRGIVSADEIVLGAATAHTLGKHIGDSVTISGDSPRPLTVVGIATLPTIGQLHVVHVSLGFGAIVVPELVPGYDLDVFYQRHVGLGPNVQFLRFRDGVDRDAEIARLKPAVLPLASVAGIDVLSAQRPSEIINAASLGNAPLLVAALFAVFAAISLGLALVASVRRRLRDLAVLRSLGFTSGQLKSAVGWHATTIVVVGLVFGVPIGIVGSLNLWRAFANQLDVVAEPHSPIALVAVVVVLAFLVANAVAVVPARAAGRVQPAILLTIVT